MKKNLSMRSKILIILIVITLLALSIQAVLFQNTSSKVVYRQAEEANIKSMQNMQEDIYMFAKSMENSIIDIYNKKEFMRDLTDGISKEKIQEGYGNILYEMAYGSFEPSQNVLALYLYSNEDECLANYRYATTPKYKYPEDIYKDEKQFNSHLVKEYVASDDMVMLVSSYYNESRHKDVVRFVLKLYANNATKKVGYLVCDVDIKSFSKIVQKYIYSDKQILWIQPHGDRPILRLGTFEKNAELYYSEASRRIEQNLSRTDQSLATHENVFFEIEQKKYNMTAFSLTPQVLLEASQRELTWKLIVIALSMLTVFWLTSVLITKSLTQPLESMVETINQIRDGNTSLRMMNLKEDELGNLGEAFNDMLSRIEGLIAKEYQIELQLNQAEYQALQAQVNPHFLYNTLDTMSGIANSQQCPGVSLLCNALSNIFRYSIDMKGPLATIEDEIKHIKNYMYVMNVRTNNSIELSFQIPYDLMEEKIPRLSLQPLVENSIRHGLKNKYGNKKIRICAKKESGQIMVSISDNGTGMDSEKINRQLDQTVLGVLEKGDSIGLNNINARLKLLFGEKYGLKAYSDEEGTTVELNIPMN